MPWSARCSAISAARSACPRVRIGYRLGLFDALLMATARRRPPNSPTRTGLAERDTCGNGRWPRPPTAISCSTRRHEQFQPDAGTGDGFRGRRTARCYLEGAFDLERGHGRRPVQGRGRIPHRCRCCLGRKLRLPVLRRRRVLPAGLRQRDRSIMAAGARRRPCRRLQARRARWRMSAAASASRRC